MPDTKTFDSSDKALNIGDVFTPVKWGEFAIEKSGIFQKWLDGASVFDPTMGEGNLLEALIAHGLKKGFPLNKLPIQNLYGNELNTRYYLEAIKKFKVKHGLDMRENFTNEDFLTLGPRQYDIIFGNPPWQNFVDLPESYKEQIKSHFFKYDLVGNGKNLLLGGSRIDIAALVIQIAIKDFLKNQGEAVFFMPLSLFLNDGANRNFRTYGIGQVKFSVESVYDFNDEDVFGGIATRYGLAHFARDKKTAFPIPYFRGVEGNWSEHLAKPMFHETDPLSIFSPENIRETEKIEPIIIKKESSPRQGINTCGANGLFFFDSLTTLDENLVRVSNKDSGQVVLPRKFVLPLITANEFKSAQTPPSKWVLLPYNQNLPGGKAGGKPMEWEQIQGFPELKDYLETNRESLQNRKGVMLNATIKRGFWWALLGVGPYNFFPYKIVWEAYGKTTFKPKIFEGEWQANQSLQAFIPVRSLEDAQRILTRLSDKKIEDYLLSLKMEGTMNWAQPGKIKKLIAFEEESLSLF